MRGRIDTLTHGKLLLQKTFDERVFTLLMQLRVKLHRTSVPRHCALRKMRRLIYTSRFVQHITLKKNINTKKYPTIRLKVILSTTESVARRKQRET